VSAEARADVVDVLEDGRSPVLVELDLTADVDTTVTRRRFLEHYASALTGSADRPPPLDVAGSYVKCFLTPDEIGALWSFDHGRAPSSAPTIFRVWPDYRLEAHIDRSISTIKSDAASRAYAATGGGVVWAVIDSGVDRLHPHFACGTFAEAVRPWSKDFTHLLDAQPSPSDDPEAPFHDPDGHGTHVAGIIAGRLPDGVRPVMGVQQRTIDGLPQWALRELDPHHDLVGVAPDCQLVSLRVLTPRDGTLVTSSSAVIAALYYVRTVLNDDGRNLRVHGVNLSLGCAWNPDDYAAGQSPLCREVDLLVGSGVVVVASAGNGGSATGTSGGLWAQSCSITDPGNAARAITVGSTHRDEPHRFGVTYTSSKGPTMDGRMKPDVLAPGERITSAATGSLRDALSAQLPTDPDGWAAYIEDSGTSMAAPHVSGAIAAFLSVRKEYAGLPEQVKQLFSDNATSLGRDRYLEGHGLIDLMRVLASV
jgi:subtilisin family serine protease